MLLLGKSRRRTRSCWGHSRCMLLMQADKYINIKVGIDGSTKMEVSSTTNEVVGLKVGSYLPINEEYPHAPFTHILTTKDENLLATLMLLGARLDPTLEKVKDELILDLSPRQRIISLLASAILEDSRLYTQIKGSALFNGVADNKWLYVRTSTFQDKHRMAQILEAVDPKGMVWPELCQWSDQKDCKQVIRSLLSECNIEYSMYDHFVQINSTLFLNSLACLILGAPDRKVDSLYAALFGADLLRAIADTVKKVSPLVTTAQLDSEGIDLTTCLKLLIGFMSIFFGTGLVLGHSMSPV